MLGKVWPWCQLLRLSRRTDDVLGSALVRVHVLVVAHRPFHRADIQIARKVEVELALGVLATRAWYLDVLREGGRESCVGGVVAAAASKQTKFKTAKIIDVPCTCDQGIDACRNCKADDHPCVCKSILIECQDQPLQLCKAKVHDCLCRVRFDGIFSKNPRVSGVKEDYSCKYIGRTTGAACGICRQHNKTENGRVQTETPAKKKPRLA